MSISDCSFKHQYTDIKYIQIYTKYRYKISLANTPLYSLYCLWKGPVCDRLESKPLYSDTEGWEGQTYKEWLKSVCTSSQRQSCWSLNCWWPQGKWKLWVEELRLNIRKSIFTETMILEWSPQGKGHSTKPDSLKESQENAFSNIV